MHVTVRRVPAEFTSIQAAVEASGPGDTIRVAGGIYGESVTIGPDKDGLAIIGSGRENVILQGEGTGVGITIGGSSRVTVAGISVTGFAVGILVETRENVIRNVAVTGSGQSGIRVTGTRNMFYRVSSSRSGESGIQLLGFFNFVVNSEFADNRDGIEMRGGTNFTYGNRASGSVAGLTAFENNPYAIANHLVGNVRGLNVTTSGGSTVIGNVLMRNTQAGANLLNLGGGLVLANEATCNREQGIRVVIGSFVKLLFNEIENNGMQGIDLQSDFCIVDDNEIEDSGAAGIRLTSDASGNLVRRNELKRNAPDIEVLAPPGANPDIDENECETSIPAGLCPCDD